MGHHGRHERLLLSPGFATLSKDFGRPTVRHWNGLAFEHGPARDATPQGASRSTIRVLEDTTPNDAVAAALKDVQADRQTEGVHCTALAADPATWELVRFTLWADRAPDAHGTRYEVLHTSSPQLHDLSSGRQW